jgi:ElaB/YqjD/DUF883 family membrane-anchored ribosome-binding protein
MGQDPETIKQQIAETRSEMSETVDALGYKADVKARAKDNVQEKVDAVTGTVGSVKDKIVGQAGAGKDQFGDTVSGATSSIGDRAGAAKAKASRAVSVAEENPLGLAIGATAVGFLAGLLIPTTNIENEKIGPVADQLKDQARDAGQDLVERGKAVASEAADTAREAVSDVADSVREAAPAA